MINNLLADDGLAEALESGLPLRIRVVTELWRDGFFDRQRGRYEWRGSITYDPLSDRYRVQISAPVSVDVENSTYFDARQTLQRNLTIPIRPVEAARYYYLVDVEVETLSLSDLEELQRWLSGDLGPAVSGEERVEGAIGSGVRRLFVRMLDLPTRRARARSERFYFDPERSPPVYYQRTDVEGQEGNDTERTVNDSIRSNRGATPIPNPSGTSNTPSSTSNSGSTTSSSQ